MDATKLSYNTLFFLPKVSLFHECYICAKHYQHKKQNRRKIQKNTKTKKKVVYFKHKPALIAGSTLLTSTCWSWPNLHFSTNIAKTIALKNYTTRNYLQTRVWIHYQSMTWRILAPHSSIWTIMRTQYREKRKGLVKGLHLGWGERDSSCLS